MNKKRETIIKEHLQKGTPYKEYLTKKEINKLLDNSVTGGDKIKLTFNDGSVVFRTIVTVVGETGNISCGLLREDHVIEELNFYCAFQERFLIESIKERIPNIVNIEFITDLS